MEHSEGILLVDKPKGITSFDVIRRLRRELGVQKLGHAGTLDPLATGLLIIGVGEGTKRLRDFLKLPKEYIAEILIGEQRTTGDMEGELLAKAEVRGIDRAQVREELHGMVGVLTLPVSAYSAIKKRGIPMYKRARKAEKTGERISELPIREMEVMEAELLREAREHGRCILTVRFHVGSGTYIRSLAEELGKRLGYPATLYDLRRTKIGEYSVEDAQPLNGIGPA